ncbi:hypothetical protein ACI6Q2_20795 [Chitinophagaceae bacterium LWZ2-11]
MRSIIYTFLAVCGLLFFTSCGSNEGSYHAAENALDGGREFIDACLKGDFAKAKFYMIDDEQNKKYLQQIEADYRKKDRNGRSQYREASINISEVADITENETIINYNNSFDKIGRKVKVIKQGGIWLVDLKYTFNPNL